MSNSIVYIGIDVSKDHLDISSQGKAHRISNSKAGLKKLLSWLKIPVGQFQLVCEATGGYERFLVAFATENNIPISVVQPALIRYFAKSENLHAKTDAIDADLIDRFASQKKPQPTKSLSALQTQFNELMLLRSQHQDKLLQAKNQLKMLELDFARKQTQELITLLEKNILALEQEIQRLVDADPPSKKIFDTCTSVKSVGKLTAFAILAYLPEIGTLSRKQIAALAGLAPYNNDSGGKVGHRSICGGRSLLRSALYMASLSAARYNPILRDFYKNLVLKLKKPRKIALIACARKLLIYLNSLIKNSYQPDFSLAN